MQTIKKHEFKRTASDGEIYHCHTYGEDLADAKRRNFNNGDGWEHIGTEEVPYLYGEIAHAIAALRPGGGKWEAKPQSEEHPNCGWDLIRYDGLTIYLHGPGYGHEQAYNFGLHAPRDNGSWVEAYDAETGKRLPNPSIGCAVTKSPEQLAKDIARRLLPDAEKTYEAVLRQIKRNIAQRNAKANAEIDLAEAAGMRPPTANNNNSERPIYLDGVVITVGHDGTSARIDGYVPIAKAKQIAAILGGAK